MPVESMLYKPNMTTLLLRMISGIILSLIASIPIPYAFLNSAYAPGRILLSV